ncbi:MAG TPA: hypothetical protein VMR52_11165 [Dehalococcoidia bacterium]|nr:hypothetical protein [Dehalococcoidia bacterium]
MISYLAFASGDDDDDGGGGGREEQQALLGSMVLTEDDTSGLSLIEASRSFSTNEESAQGTRDPAETLAQFEAWGRQLGLSVAFLPDSQATGQRTFLGVQSDASLYEDAQGCSLSYSHDVDLAEEADWAGSFPELTEVEVTEITPDNVGEEVYWVRVSGVTSDGQNLQIVDQVVFRVGNVRAFLRADAQYLANAPRNSGEGQVLFWAQVMADRAEAGATG